MLWAVGRYDLRLTDEEFWHMVPRQFAALMRQRHQDHLRQEFGPAMVCASLYNSHGLKADYTKFMPSFKAVPKTEATWEDQLAKVKVLHAALGGAQ